ncbi:uncharacterized protein [Chlorocebus sabaeus]|uniref:uncharacterized protein n=1 Tax=Chlorocebus sabaeus TaxID=60711 RepID=UPI003BFA2011
MLCFAVLREPSLLIVYLWGPEMRCQQGDSQVESAFGQWYTPALLDRSREVCLVTARAYWSRNYELPEASRTLSPSCEHLLPKTFPASPSPSAMIVNFLRPPQPCFLYSPWNYGLRVPVLVSLMLK